MTKGKTKVKGWDTIDALRKGKTIIARFYYDDWTYCMKDGRIHKLANNGTWQYAPNVKLDDLLSFEFEIIPRIPEPKFDLNFMEAIRMTELGQKVVNDLINNKVYDLETVRSHSFDLAEIKSKWRVVE